MTRREKKIHSKTCFLQSIKQIQLNAHNAHNAKYIKSSKYSILQLLRKSPFFPRSQVPKRYPGKIPNSRRRRRSAVPKHLLSERRGPGSNLGSGATGKHRVALRAQLRKQESSSLAPSMMFNRRFPDCMVNTDWNEFARLKHIKR